MLSSMRSIPMRRDVIYIDGPDRNVSSLKHIKLSLRRGFHYSLCICHLKILGFSIISILKIFLYTCDLWPSECMELRGYKDNG